MTVATASGTRFELTADELCALRARAPGLVLPSFVRVAARPDLESTLAGLRERGLVRFDGGIDSQLLLALSLQQAAEAVVQVVCWSPVASVEQSVAIANVVVATLTAHSERNANGTRFEVRLLPISRVFEAIAATIPELPEGKDANGARASVSIVASRAIVEAIRTTNAANVETVVAEIGATAEDARILAGLARPQTHGFRIKVFDEQIRSCTYFADWYASDRGWLRVAVALPEPRGGHLTAVEVVEDGAVTVSEVSSAALRADVLAVLAGLGKGHQCRAMM